jgi:hypothetical protein
MMHLDPSVETRDSFILSLSNVVVVVIQFNYYYYIFNVHVLSNSLSFIFHRISLRTVLSKEEEEEIPFYWMWILIILKGSLVLICNNSKLNHSLGVLIKSIQNSATGFRGWLAPRRWWVQPLSCCATCQFITYYNDGCRHGVWLLPWQAKNFP